MISNQNLQPAALVGQPYGLVVLSGPQAASRQLLQICAHLALTKPVRILDCGNRSNMYAVAKAIRLSTRDPAAAMQHITLTRAFTSYQCEALFRNNRCLTNTVILVLDLLATFFDESIARKESERLFHKSLDHLQILKQTNQILVGITPLNVIPEQFTRMISVLHTISDGFHLTDAPAENSAIIDPQLSLF